MAIRLALFLAFICAARADIYSDAASWTGGVYIAIAGDSIAGGVDGAKNLGTVIAGATSPSLTSTNAAVGGKTWQHVNTNQFDLISPYTPRYLFVHAGINDLFQNWTWSNAVTNLNSVLSKCAAANIRLIVGEVLPDHSTVAPVSALAIRTWNTNLTAWVATNTGVWLLVQHDSFGQLRESTGFLDDLKDEYNRGDNIHINLAGYTNMAGLLIDKLTEIHATGTTNQQRTARVGTLIKR